MWQRNEACPHTEKPYTILCLDFEKVVLAFYHDCFKLIIMTPSGKKKKKTDIFLKAKTCRKDQIPEKLL